MSETLHCWQCGAEVTGEPLPLSRRAECPACRAELHTCRQCVFYSTHIAGQCRETRAEEVNNKSCSNFCDWFQLQPQPAAGPGAPADARAKLDALFGGGSETAAKGPTQAEKDASHAALDDLFGTRD
ncbi:MAG: hypothetical protein KDG50_00840 [Chromatiales bacterium]|nr:hypothetical protein [Chromatiales bacterium]